MPYGIDLRIHAVTVDGYQDFCAKTGILGMDAENFNPSMDK